MLEKTDSCLNCGKPLKSKFKYCPRCGQSVKTDRLDMREVQKNLQKRVLHAESGIIQLTLALAKRPGIVALEYVQGMRKKYYNPLKYLTLSAAVSVFINEYFHLMEGMHAQPNPGSEIAARYYNLIILFSVPVSAYFSWLLFRKKGFNYAENLTLQAYLGGFRTVFFVLIFTPLIVWFRQYYYYALTAYMVAWVGYIIWAKWQFFGGPFWKTAFKSILVVLFNQIVITSAITAVIVIRLRSQ